MAASADDQHDTEVIGTGKAIGRKQIDNNWWETKIGAEAVGTGKGNTQGSPQTNWKREKQGFVGVGTGLERASGNPDKFEFSEHTGADSVMFVKKM